MLPSYLFLLIYDFERGIVVLYPVRQRDRETKMYSNTPPAPPPKPGSHDASRMGTPATTQSPRPPPPIPDQHSNLPEAMGGATAQAQITRPESIPDPGDQWLPKFLQDKSCVLFPRALTPAPAPLDFGLKTAANPVPIESKISLISSPHRHSSMA